uniref:long-chain-fatty-acid--CoA ligase n=1 Tax=Myripristis murdjan TaxID=586833 RepID=A0A667WMH1_9TELE
MLIWIICAAVFIGLLIRNPYFFQDVHFLITLFRVRLRVSRYRERNYSILDRFLDVVKTQPHKPFVLFKDETYSYQDADKLSNKVARALLDSGAVTEGDTAALLVGNEPVFLWLWLGLLKLGCPVAFLNYNMKSQSLLHCFHCSGAKALIAAEDDLASTILPHVLEQSVRVFILADQCQTSGMESFRDKVNQASTEPLPSGVRSHFTLLSPAVYIYTSGTTGLPKAAVMTHLRIMSMTTGLALMGITSSDVIYTTLPLYHAAGFMGFTATIERGMTFVLRNKFSASNFWEDCRKFNVTVIQYIGEIMRYLCNTPKKDSDRCHKVRLAMGNGIRAEVWREFLNRFGNIQIKEFYGATEGNLAIHNYVCKIGAVGRVNFLHKKAFPYAVIKYDHAKDEPLRDSSGFCIEAAKGEPGLMVIQITQRAPFIGYARDLKQTEKKKLHDVFKKGDVYFNTGDMLCISKDNFIYFHDRIGDTFRWKGENVATNEVSDVINVADGIKEANVYGVHVPGHEGKAGMAAVLLKDGEKFDCIGVFKHLEKFLPAYARPRFIRIQNSLEITGTFKYMKVKLVEEGFDPNKITDPLYFLDEREGKYIPLTQEIFSSVITGKMKL